MTSTTTYRAKSNDNKVNAGATVMDHTQQERIILPLPPESAEARQEMEIYVRFMRHLRHVANSRMDIKILAAIEVTSDMMDIGDALVAKILADLGLRAPRRAFPGSYLDHVDKSLLRSGWEIGGPTASALAMKQHWDMIGEDRFSSVKRDYSFAEASVGMFV